MCEYCDCRSQPVIAALSAEHDQLGSLTILIEQAIHAGDATNAWRHLTDLATLLAAHTASEEAGLFADLLAAGELTDAVFARCAEHDEISAAVDAAGQPDSDPVRWEETARRALTLLAEHIWREETDVFPAAALALAAISLGAAR